MNISHRLMVNAGMTVAGLMLTGAIATDNPHLLTTGMNLGVSTTVGRLLVKKNEQTCQQQQQQQLNQQAALVSAYSSQEQALTKIEQSLAQKLTKIEEKIEKNQYQLRTQLTRQNLTLSKVSKLKHQQMLLARTVSQTEEKVEIVETAQQEAVKAITKPSPLVILPPSPPKPQPKTHVYIDGNNLRYSLKDLGIEPDYRALANFLTPKEGETVLKFYMGAFSNPSRPQRRLRSQLEKLGYQVSSLPIVRRGDGGQKTMGDDLKLGIEMFEEVQSGDTAILVTGDGDFMPVVKRIKERGVEVKVVANIENLYAPLAHLADEFIDLDKIKYDIAKHTKLVLKKVS